MFQLYWRPWQALNHHLKYKSCVHYELSKVSLECTKVGYVGPWTAKLPEYTLNLLVYLIKDNPVINNKLYKKSYEHLEETKNTT